MAKPPPKSTNTFINKVVREFYDCTVSDLPIYWDIPDGENVDLLRKSLHRELFKNKEFDISLFKLNVSSETRVIRIGLR